MERKTMSKEEALKSLRMAKSYLDKLGEKIDLLESGDESLADEFARSLELALYHIQLIEKNDETISLENYDLNDAKWDYNFLRGALEYFKGKYNAAIRYLRQALKIIPHSLASSRIHLILSNCYWNLGNKEDAIENIKCAIELDPENIKYKKELSRMINAKETIYSPPLEEENDKKMLARKNIYVSIALAMLGSICCFIYLKSNPRESPLLVFGWAYVFWATYWGWKALHGLTKKVISGISSTGCLIVIPAIQWIMIGIYYIGIMIPAAAIFGSIGGGIAAFLVHLKRAAMSAKAVAMSLGSLFIFSFILVLLSFNSRRDNINFKRPAYDKERQPSLYETRKQESKITPPHQEPIESQKEQKIIITQPIPLLSLDEAKQSIPHILERIYQCLDQGNPRAAGSFITSEILSNSTKLDIICKPFAYRAHYIESIIERPENKFEVRIRVLFQPMEESAQVLIFRAENDSLVLENASSYLEDLLNTWKKEAMEVSRNFYYALKADKQDVLMNLVSSQEVIYPKIATSSRFSGSYRDFQIKLESLGEIGSIYCKITPYKGLKARVDFGSYLVPDWVFYVDNIDGEYKIVEWHFYEPILRRWEAYGRDPNIESYTLKRFESRKELSISRTEAIVQEEEVQKGIDERQAVHDKKAKQELEERDRILEEIKKEKVEDEQKIKIDEAIQEKKPVRAIGEIKPPKLIKKVEPIYPEIAIKDKIEGVVILEVTTDIYGRVKNIKILRSIPPLDQAAIDALKQWEYESVIIKGEPRAVIFTQTVRFRLPN